MKKLLIGVMIIATLSYLIISNISSDMVINKYDNRQAVIEQKAIKGGYIPEIIPSSAYDIVEMHDKKSDEFYGAFSYKEPDESALLGKLVEIKDTNGTMAWGEFLFLIDRDTNRVKFRNKVDR